MTLRRARFDAPDETREFEQGMGKLEIVRVGGHDVARSTFEPGWRWC
jgi:hypothetical protein